MRILVTGGAGSIGVYVVRALLNRGDDVTIVDTFNDFYDPAFKRARLAAVLAGGRSPAVLGVNVADAPALQQSFAQARPEAIIHLAAWPGVRPSIAHPLLYTRENVEGTVGVLHAAVQHGVRQVVFASSSSVYPKATPLPFREDAPCDTTLSPYSASKRAGELYARLYHDLHGLSVVCVRFFTVYGPWIRPDMAMWKFTERIIRGEPVPLRRTGPGGAEVKRDFTYVEDIVRGVLSALDRSGGFDIINLGNNTPVPLSRFVRLIEEALGKSAIIHEEELGAGEEIATAADLTHAREALGYAPTIAIDEGVRRFVAWYQKEFLPKFPNGLAPSPYWA
ncbi:MAG: NAD-dependent epimerase/dehydratase [Parcubacteria group bacterium Gr01-1014_38]|nr:MAG: NAD-dependent epimerase/dehydratase [Parcubacteria group bacterium Gr01-1014_38]